MTVLFATVGGFVLSLLFVGGSVEGGSRLLGRNLQVKCGVGAGKIVIDRSRIL